MLRAFWALILTPAVALALSAISTASLAAELLHTDAAQVRSQAELALDAADQADAAQRAPLDWRRAQQAKRASDVAFAQRQWERAVRHAETARLQARLALIRSSLQERRRQLAILRFQVTTEPAATASQGHTP